MNRLAALLVVLAAALIGSAAVAGLFAGSAYWWERLIALGLLALCVLAGRRAWRHL